MKTNKKELLDSFKGGLIVSCQVQHDDPTFSVDFVVKMAKAAQWGGAVGHPCQRPGADQGDQKRGGFTSNRALENLAR